MHGAKPGNLDNKGRTTLHYAGMRNHDYLASALLDFDPSIINNVDIFGNSALHCAARRGYIEVARVLRWFGANPALPNKKGVTPEQFAHELAAATRDPGIVRAVCEQPASSPFPPCDKAEYELFFSLVEKQVCRILHVEKLEYPHPTE